MKHFAFRFARLPAYLPSWLFFAACWAAGLALGAAAGLAACETYLLLMRRAALSPVSIVCRFLVPLLPFLIAAFADLFSKPRVLPALAGLKAFFFSLSACACYRSFGSAAWLVFPMLRFADVLLLPVFCLLCLNILEHGAAKRLWVYGACAAAWMIACALDCFWISPFLRTFFC